ncbi:MAG: hypothetical protein EOP48_00770 [Sphingobacteriales bacterium]|nr:MAG: hypothetical protein EOP48_00770 [Sphingobacteriales bacterium]
MCLLIVIRLLKLAMYLKAKAERPREAAQHHAAQAFSSFGDEHIVYVLRLCQHHLDRIRGHVYASCPVKFEPLVPEFRRMDDAACCQ